MDQALRHQVPSQPHAPVIFLIFVILIRRCILAVLRFTCEQLELEDVREAVRR